MPSKNERHRRPLLSVEEAAELLGQSRSSLYRAIERGDLPFPVFTINGRYRIALRSVELVIAGDLGGTNPAGTTGHGDRELPGGGATPGGGWSHAARESRSQSSGPGLRRCARRLGGPPR